MLKLFYLGIDQHASQLTISLRNGDGDVVVRKQVSTKPRKILEFFEMLTRRCLHNSCSFWAIVEVCGFNEWLIEMLKNFRCQKIVLIQPKDSSRKKTDRRDAAKLSELLWLYRNRLAENKPINKLKIVAIPTARQNSLRRLTTLRKLARANQTRAINQIKYVLRRHNLQHELPTKTFPTIAAMDWLKKLKLPEADRMELDFAIEDYHRHDERVKALDQPISAAAEHDQDAALLMQTPGIAPFSAVALSCRIAGIDRFKRPRALANYFGLTPGCRNSGKKERIGKITKAGSCMCRWVLGLATKHIFRVDPAMRAWFRKLKRKRGSKVALVAVMRRLATIIWHMLRKRKTYSEVRSLGIGLQQ
jgi:transposase